MLTINNAWRDSVYIDVMFYKVKAWRLRQADLRQERRSQSLFCDDPRADNAIVGDDFGLVTKDDFFNDGP
jgi:hypothetical protein